MDVFTRNSRRLLIGTTGVAVVLFGENDMLGEFIYLSWGFMLTHKNLKEKNQIILSHLQVEPSNYFKIFLKNKRC